MTQVNYLSNNKKILMSVSPRAGNNTCAKFLEPCGDVIRHKQVISSFINNSSFLTIRMIRNPYERVISSFIWASGHDKQLFNGKELTFNNFLDCLKGKNMSSVNFHYGLQTDGYKFDYVLRTEDQYDTAKHIIKKERNLDLVVPPRIRFTQKYTPESKVYDTERNSLRKEGMLPVYEFYYDDEGTIKNKVYNLYKQDILMYENIK